MAALLVKLLALAAYFGGPMLIFERLKLVLPNLPAFVVSFLPIGLLSLGALSIRDDTSDRVSRWFVTSGVVGAAGVLLANAAASYELALGRVPANRAWIGIGIGVGSAYSLGFIRLGLRFLRGVPGRARPRAERRAGPNAEDWVLLLISSGFVAAGFFLLGKDPKGAAACLIFFGSAWLLFAHHIAQKYRAARRVLPADAANDLPGGVAIRPSRRRVALIFGGLFAFGASLFVFGEAIGDVFRGLSALIAAIGAIGLVLLVVGRIPVGFLRFDPDGITVARRDYRFQIPWDAIAVARAGEFQRNPALFVLLSDPGLVRPEPQFQAEKVQRELARSLAWMGVHLVILTANYGLDLPLLAAAIARYRQDPAARWRLSAPRLE